MNENSQHSLVNSVDFQPGVNRFCVTFTHNNRIVIYHLDENERVNIFQILENPLAKLSCPQHAVYSSDGHQLVIANWLNKTFNVYLAGLDGYYQQTPIAVIPFPRPADRFRPHGIVFSPDGSSLFLTFSETNSVIVYAIDFSNERIIPTPRQIFSGAASHLSRPEDIKFTPQGNEFAVSNSNSDSVTFYKFDVFFIN